MGVRTVIVAINKMDAVGFKHVAFEEFAGERPLGRGRASTSRTSQVIPVSALTGDNVIEQSTEMRLVPRPDGARAR